jgi:hypothetical protein
VAKLLKTNNANFKIMMKGERVIHIGLSKAKEVGFYK